MIENIPVPQIEMKLSKQKNKCLIFYGPSGIGKTSNALNFAWRMIEEKWICLWFNSDTEETFLNDLIALTDLMNETNDENTSFEYRMQLLKNEFRLNLEITFLIILDNLNETVWIESVLKNLSKNVSIIATSTKKNLLEHIADGMKIKHFNEIEAKSFFRKKFENNRYHNNKFLSLEENNLLDKYFKYNSILPYDLNLLVSELINNESINLKELFEDSQDLCEKIFNELYKRVERESPAAWKMLKYFCSFDRVAFQVLFVMKQLNILKIDLEKIINILEKHSLIELSERNINKKLEEKYIYIHRRTQEMVKKVIKILPNEIQNEEVIGIEMVFQNKQDEGQKSDSTKSYSRTNSLTSSDSVCIFVINNFYTYRIH